MSELSPHELALRQAAGATSAARFEGEEAANVVRAVIAVALVVCDQPAFAIALACFVFAVATVVRSGRFAMPLSLLTIGVDTMALVWGLEGGRGDSRALLVLGAIGVLMATLRLSPVLTLGAGLHAGAVVRGAERASILVHPSSVPSHEPSYALVPVALGLLVAGVLALASRRLTRPPRSAREPLDETAAIARRPRALR